MQLIREGYTDEEIDLLIADETRRETRKKKQKKQERKEWRKSARGEE
jgi:ribosomal protein S9